MLDTPETNEETPHGNQAADSAPDPQVRPKSGDDDLDFVVTEAHGQTQELVGAFQTEEADDLGLESTADLMEAEASREVSDLPEPDPATPSPIGETAPPPPPPPDQPPNSSSELTGETIPNTVRTPVPESGLQKLSAERVKEISEQMRGGSSGDGYLSNEEKQRLLQSIDEAPSSPIGSPPAEPGPKTGFDTKPIVLPSKQKSASQSNIPATTPDPIPTRSEIEPEVKRPRKSTRVRGVAYFARQYIKITGGQEIHEGDTLTVNNREYLLRHKKSNNRLILGIAVPLAAILIFALGAMLSSDANTGAGHIVGLVVSDDDRPFITGSEIRFPELGRSYQSNGQGFFKTDPLDAGSYKIEFVYEDQVIATDYATVVAEKITTITLRPTPPESPPAGREQVAEPVVQATQTNPERSVAAAKPPPTPAKPKATPAKSTSVTSRWSKLALEADVDGAKLTIDGSVLGAGNLTYSKLKPGLHKYVVSKEGYQPYEGSIDLKAGRTRTLNISLTPNLVIPAERQSFDRAKEALDQGQWAAAITDFSEAIEAKPSYTEAYLGRARAHEQNRDTEAAHDDYIRAAEVLAFRRDFNRSYSTYEKALKLNPKSIPAFLGRGNLYLTRSEEIAAIADFDMVVRLDKRNVFGYLGLGQARYNQGYFKKAIKHFKDARSIESKNPGIHRHLMICYYRAGDFKQVKKSYEKFVKYASPTELQRLKSEPSFVPVLEIIGNRN